MSGGDLPQGGNAALTGDRVVVALRWPLARGGGIDADASAYLLTAAGKVRGDADMIFYNQPADADGAVRFVAVDAGAAGNGGGDGGGRFEIDLARVPAAIERIAICVTIHEAQVRGQTMAALAGAEIAIGAAGTPAGAPPAWRYCPALIGAIEAAMTFGELYRRQGAWKFRAVGQGFAGGLAPLARWFGIDVAEPPAAPPAPAPVPPPPPPPVRLSKVTLEKRGQAVSLAKQPRGFGEIVVNLNWSRPPKGMFGGGTAIDLDLGCLFELADGRLGVVQALGRVFGSYAKPPYIELSGDDRTGDVAAGETLRINGAHWPDLKRIAIFANIYDGVPNWKRTDGVVTVTMPDQAPIEVRMTEGRDDRRLCGVLLIENDGGALKATRIVEYFADQEKLDQHLRWGLRWKAGRK